MSNIQKPGQSQNPNRPERANQDDNKNQNIQNPKQAGQQRDTNPRQNPAEDRERSAAAGARSDKDIANPKKSEPAFQNQNRERDERNPEQRNDKRS